MCSGDARPRFEALDGHPQLEYVVDTSDGPRRGAAGFVEQVARNGSTALAETGRVFQRACDGVDQLICASNHVGRASQEAHLIRAYAGLLDQARAIDDDNRAVEQHEFESNRAVVGDQRVSNKEIWRRVGVPGHVDARVGTELLQARSPVRPSRSRRSVGSYNRSCSFTMRLRPRRGSVSMTALPKAFSDEWGDHVGAYRTVGTSGSSPSDCWMARRSSVPSTRQSTLGYPMSAASGPSWSMRPACA